MKSCIVLGDASSVYEDAERALALFKPDATFATNNIGIQWEGHVDYWCTLHSLPCRDWPGMAAAVEKRVARGLNKPELWANRAINGINNRTADWGGSTGLLAVKVALEKGFDRIVLAGVPMTVEGGHFYDGNPWDSAGRFKAAWRRRIRMFEGRIRSMSGWTRDLFGEPDAEWLRAT